MNFEIAEIVKQYEITFIVNDSLIKIYSKILRHNETESFSYVTNQQFKNLNSIDFYTPGAAANSIEEARVKMFNYLAEFEEAINNHAITRINPTF